MNKIKVQTALDWFVKQLKKGKELKNITKLLEQAKKMEKEQIKEAWIDGVTNWDSEKEVEDYIKEIFK
jgi:hypothetical protein